MTTIAYPKVSQEMIRDVLHVVKSAMANSSYVDNSPYSHLMRDVINREVKSLMFAVAQGKIGSSTGEPKDPNLTAHEAEEKELDDIEKQFSSLSADLDKRSTAYKDDFGILLRMEKAIRGVERLMSNGGTDSVKLQASTRFMDLQEKQIELLERLANISRVTNIEAMTKRFFNELKKHPDMTVIANRYLELLEGLN